MKKVVIIVLMFLVQPLAFANNTSVGLGFGIPYGVIGANISYKINETFDITAGAGAGFGVGLKYHPLDSIKEFRVTAYYGANAYLSDATTRDIEIFNGLNIGIGYGSLLNGWDVDLMIVLTSGIEDEIAELQDQEIAVSDYNDYAPRLSFGYHW